MSRHLGSVSELRRSRAYRSIARVAIVGQLLTLLPCMATTSAAQTPIALLAADQRPTNSDGRPDAAVAQASEPKRVIVNRTVPRVRPRAIAPTLSAEPADREFFDARIFAEPLVPIGATTAEDNRALGQVLRQYLEDRNRENVSVVLAHLQRFPASPWRSSLLANIGTVFSEHGYYTRAFESWNSAWQLSKDATDPRARAVADYAIAQWLELMTRFGDVTALEGKLKELEGRKLTGSTGAKIKVARESLWILKNHHEWATPSARTALASWLYVRSPAYARARAKAEMTADAAAAAERASASANLGAPEHAGGPAFRMPKALADFHAKAEGTSLRQLAALAGESGLRVRAAYRPAGAPLVTPAIAHLRPGHYSFVLRHEEGRVLLRDVILGGEIWISRAALEEESSGYWLINDGPLPNEWRDVQEHEAAVVIGRCAPGGASDYDPCECGGGGGPSGGMPSYYFHPVSTSLRLVDTPLGYEPPRGPGVYFTLSYNHREVLQPSTFTYSNLGPMWTYDWLSYVQEIPIYTSPGGNVFNAHTSVFLRGSGLEDYRNPDANGVYPAFFRSRAVLVKVSESPVRYERRLPDGSMEVFTQSDGAPSGQRQIFLTSVVDPQGQALQITYDAQLRAVAFTDALGQVTTISYDHATDPLKITKVTDPFGRFATFTYTPSGQLASITDVLGLTSSFTYASNDFISALTTPYGTTTFRHETNVGYPRMIEATDPLGGTEHQEYHYQNTSILNAEPAALVPTGFTAYNENLQFYNTFYWSKRQWALHPGDVTKATRTHWLLYDLNPDDQNHGVAGNIPHSVKQPLENAVWYAYPGQSSKRWVGSWTQPERVGRVLDNGTSQISESTYNSNGQQTLQIDPLGRRTSYIYAANGIDLLEVRNTTGSLNELLTQYGSYGADHLPRTVTDASGETTTRTYNANGQALTLVNSKNETTTFAYDTSGYLSTVTGPVAGNTASYTYDAYGRIRTATNVDGYTITSDYDAFNRPTRTTHPDGTYEETLYDRLDAVRHRDRRGRWTRTVYDSLRRPIALRDPDGGTTTAQWCACGSLEKLTDAKGQVTSWTHDVQGRVLTETRANATQTSYVYELTTSRTKTVTDALGQVSTYSYSVDDSLQQVAYSNAVIATPSVTYVYDPNYRRVTTATASGVGPTVYTYKPVGALGANRIASVNGPMANDTVEYDYDELGRVVTRTVNGAAAAFTYDALGRRIGETNALGTFTYGYDGVTERLASVTYPNGQTTQYGYSSGTDVKRLSMLHHKRPGGTTLSRFDYTYDTTGNVVEVQHQTDSGSPLLWQYGYDRRDQLVRAIQSSTSPSAVLKRFAYSYDAAGNRTAEQIDDIVKTSTYSNVNALQTLAGGGVLQVAGTLSEAGQVTIAGKPAAADAANGFRGTVDLPTGTNTFTVSAADSSGNTASKTYEVTLPAASGTRSYDLNGNTLSDGARTFEWDAENRLVAIVMGTHRTEFTYDGEGRRARMAERESGTLIADFHLVWGDRDLVEVREVIANVTTRLFEFGEQQGTVSLFYTRDRLGSVMEMLDATATLRARYTFDPYGRRTKVTGDLDATLGFTGLVAHGPTQLLLASYRQYDPEIGRWLSQDPLGLQGESANLYTYADNSPTTGRDPLGLLTSWQAYQHYRGGTGTPLTMSFFDIDTSSVRPTSFDQVKKYTEGGQDTLCCDKGGKVINIDARKPFATSGDQALFLGNITLRLQGTLHLEGNGKWRFEGTLGAFDDYYDFNASTHRGRIAEWLTNLGSKTKGKPYWINIRGKKAMSEAGAIECKKKKK